MTEEIYQGDVYVKQNTNQKAPNPYLNRQTITTVIIVVVLAICGIYYIWDNFMGIKPDVQINGTRISMRNTVQDLLDAGFVLCNDKGHVSKDLDWTVNAKEVYNYDYYIGIPTKSGSDYCYCSGVKITVANFNNVKKDFKDCTILAITYYPGSQDDFGVEVLIHGEDLSEADFDTWVDFFEQTGYPFEKDELEGFRRGDRLSVYEKKGAYKYEANVLSMYGKRYLFSLSFTRDVDVTYKYR